MGKENGKMKTKLFALGLLLCGSIQAFAIEGLNITVPSTNAVLSWPSDPSETYIIQYRNSLSVTDSWATLADFYPADGSTNITFFIDTNFVNQSSGSFGGSGGGGGGIPIPGGGGGSTNYGGTNAPITGTGFYRVVRDGAHIYGLTNNSILHDQVQLPLEIAVTSTDTIESVTFYNSADDSPVIGVTAYTNANGGWVFDWNTTMVQNGSYSIYAEVDFTTDTPVSSANLPVAINVNNTISFPNYFSRMYGGQMWVYAETIPNAPFTIDMYDESTNYLGTFSGSANSGGVISFLWDLTDGYGNAFDSTNFYGVFTITTSSFAAQTNMPASNWANNTSAPNFQTLGQAQRGGGPNNGGPTTASARQTWAIEFNWWNYGDGFVVAYSPLVNPATDPNTVYKESLMMIGGDGGIYGGVVSALSYYGLAYQLSPGNVAQSSAFEMGDGAAKTNLLNYLASYSYRNFYFFGHGNPSVIAGITPDTAINKYTIAKRLGNFLWGSKPENFHPYRLVFIDGCDVGKGNFCEAFGIPAQNLNNQFFANAGVRSRAFLGFKNSISFNVNQWSWRSIMLGTFFEQWQANTPLNQCVYNAQQANVQPMDSSAVIYGAADLQKSSP